MNDWICGDVSVVVCKLTSGFPLWPNLLFLFHKTNVILVCLWCVSDDRHKNLVRSYSILLSTTVPTTSSPH